MYRVCALHRKVKEIDVSTGTKYYRGVQKCSSCVGTHCELPPEKGVQCCASQLCIAENCTDLCMHMLNYACTAKTDKLFKLQST